MDIAVGCMVPAGVATGHAYRAQVSNGFATAVSTTTVAGHNSGTNYFSIQQSWGIDYIVEDGPGYKPGQPGSVEADHHIFNVVTDPALTVHAAGNGVTNDAPAIQAAIEKVKLNGGGIVFLPAGTYNVGVSGLVIRPGTVLQGHSSSDTKIIFGPTTKQAASFSMAGITIPDNASMTGIADLSIQDVDQLSQFVVNLDLRGGTFSKFFIQRVNWDLGTGRQLGVNGDRIDVENSTFHQDYNTQDLQSDGTGMVGPIWWDPVSNLTFAGNTVTYWTGQILMDDLNNALIDGNHFTRIADPIVAGPQQAAWNTNIAGRRIAVGDHVQLRQGRGLSTQFGKNVLITNNKFDVDTSRGPLYYNWNDCETILNEARDRDDMGVLASANASSATAQPKSSGSWNYYSNSMIIIASGKGAGQWRHITQRNGNAFTIDQPWLVIPSAGDHFVISVPSYENAIIHGNTLKDSPRGIVLYRGAFFNVNVTWNTLTDNGGISLEPFDSVVDGAPSFNVSRNVEINNNTVTNTKGFVPAFIDLSMAMIQHNAFWGYNMLGVEVRNNQITAVPGTFPYPFGEGYYQYVVYQNSAPYVEQSKSALGGDRVPGQHLHQLPDRLYHRHRGSRYSDLGIKNYRHRRQ